MATATAPPSRPRRLRRSNLSARGYARRRCGKGFVYRDEEGERITDPEAIGRITSLVIPPAWKDVWISPDPFGHIQATGIDARGRKQYLYHPRWRERRDQEKFDSMVAFARSLPALRSVVDNDIALGDMSREQVLACAARLLDRGFFRIGSEEYAVSNETYGLATMLKSHVTLDGETIRFDYIAKESKRRLQAIVDPEVAEIIGTLKRRRGGGEELLAYKQDGRWCDVRSPDINAYLKAATSRDISAKDFRTWGATVLAAVGLAVTQPQRLSAAARKRAIMRAVKEVAFYLGNTPTVARSSYIDPRVVDRYTDGQTIPLELIGVEPESTAIQGPVEEAVLELLED
ncbi:MAG: DNA topoisomerase IB (poxvirus type) [uncultured Solirubrobacteraceae bacterium]|uniref:DNA topoisomerase n=1 Tax=uncultured Solirubrobacteraceae bacterium TaxID=1162706 RepID=A0A6J4TEM3_9ACTN|nr:MAG: DNA topoisomerase IB (poxvirus type) [uncultured Solirubrobacteraceae bacterium]